MILKFRGLLLSRRGAFDFYEQMTAGCIAIERKDFEIMFKPRGGKNFYRGSRKIFVKIIAKLVREHLCEPVLVAMSAPANFVKSKIQMCQRSVI